MCTRKKSNDYKCALKYWFCMHFRTTKPETHLQLSSSSALIMNENASGKYHLLFMPDEVKIWNWHVFQRTYTFFLYPRSKGKGVILFSLRGFVRPYVRPSVCLSACLSETKNYLALFLATVHRRCLNFKYTLCLGIPYVGIYFCTNRTSTYCYINLLLNDDFVCF